MGSRDDAEALAAGQRAARSAIPEWDRATTQKLWPQANAQQGARPGGPRNAASESEGFAS
jgi:hypothetical protein